MLLFQFMDPLKLGTPAKLFIWEIPARRLAIQNIVWIAEKAGLVYEAIRRRIFQNNNC